MKARYFYRQRAILYAESIDMEYGVQTGKDGKNYVINQFPSKEDYLERFKSDLDDPTEELEDFDNFSDEEIDKMETEAMEMVSESYDEVAREREEFLKEE